MSTSKIARMDRTGMELFATGGSGDNWDLYERRDIIFYIAKKDGAADGVFGNYDHIMRLIRNDIFFYTLTDYGKELMKGRIS